MAHGWQMDACFPFSNGSRQNNMLFGCSEVKEVLRFPHFSTKSPVALNQFIALINLYRVAATLTIKTQVSCSAWAAFLLGCPNNRCDCRVSAHRSSTAKSTCDTVRQVTTSTAKTPCRSVTASSRQPSAGWTWLLRSQELPLSYTTGLQVASGIHNELPACCTASSNLTRKAPSHSQNTSWKPFQKHRDCKKQSTCTCSKFQRSFKNHGTATQTLNLWKLSSLLLSSLAS